MTVDVRGVVSHRIDRSLSIREEVGFFGTSGARLFGARAEPLDPPLGGIVVCSPIHADAVKQYRREVLFGRALASAGFAVQRFHYRGFGNSDGEGRDVTFAGMHDDAIAAADELRARSGVDELLYLGIGWGGLVAAAAVGSSSMPIALWQPVLDAPAFFTAAMRARAIAALKEAGGMQSTEEDLLEELRDEGSLDVLGYSIDRTLFESSSEVELASPLLERPRKVLLLQVAKGTSLSGKYRRLADALTGAGSSVETGWIEAEDRSWFIENEWRVEEDRASTQALNDRTKAWVLSILPMEASA
jgi:alpha/beta superfamily hydrolase